MLVTNYSTHYSSFCSYDLKVCQVRIPIFWVLLFCGCTQRSKLIMSRYVITFVQCLLFSVMFYFQKISFLSSFFFFLLPFHRCSSFKDSLTELNECGNGCVFGGMTMQIHAFVCFKSLLPRFRFKRYSSLLHS